MRMNFIMVVTDNYVKIAKVAIWSVIKNTKCDDIRFYILSGKELDEQNKESLVEICRKKQGVNFVFQKINTCAFTSVDVDERIPMDCYIRLLAAEICDDNKCIVLDGDIIADTDLEELYMTDIREYYLGGVLETWNLLNPNYNVKHVKEANLKSISDYLNAGVMLLNLEMFRRDGITEKMMAEINENNIYLDEDVFNRVCHKHIKLLDWTFNYNTYLSDYEHIFYNGESTRAGKGRVYHYVGPNKPWDKEKKYGLIWWNYAKDALNHAEYENLRSAYNERKKFEYLPIIDTDKVVIVGYSNNGIEVSLNLRKNCYRGEIIYADNDINKQNLDADKVYPVDELLLNNSDEYIWINCVQKAKAEIYDQLSNGGIKDTRILEWYKDDLNGNYFVWRIDVE